MSSYSVIKNISFIHIPKCAGSSVRKALRSVVPDLQDFNQIDRQHRKTRHPALSNHYPVWYIQTMLSDYGYPLLLEQFNHMNKFMVMRNPWARMVSLYFHRMRKLHLWHEGKPRNEPDDIACAEKGFTHWLLYTPSKMDKILTTMPQASWGKNTDGELSVDILSFEQLEKDFSKYLYLNKLPSSNLPHTLKGKGHADNYQDYYTNQESIDHVAKYFKEDIEIRGYDF